MKLETAMFMETFNQVINNTPYQIFLWLVVLDLITGLGKGLKLKRIDSRLSTDGMLRHVIVVMVVTLTSVYGRILGFEFAASSVGYWYMGSYFVSILENSNALGVNYPPALTQYFNRMQNSYNDKLENAIKEEGVPKEKE